MLRLIMDLNFNVPKSAYFNLSRWRGKQNAHEIEVLKSILLGVAFQHPSRPVPRV